MRARPAITFLFLLSWWTSALAETPVITVSTNNTPMDRKALLQLSQEAFRRAGAEFKLVSLPSERSLKSADAGEVDGEGLRVAGLTAQYPNLVQVPERYVRISFVAFAKDATINLDNGWESNATGARAVTKVDKPEQMFQMLDGGRVDLALYTRADGLALARGLGLPSIAPVWPALKDVDMYLYLHKKHEALVPRLVQALKAMKTDGSYNRILSGIYVE